MRKQIITLLFILSTVYAFAQPVLVNTVSSSGNVSGLTIPFTVSSNSNRVLVVSVTSKDKNITSVKYGGTNLTQVALLSQNSMHSGLFYLIAPATGSANVVIAIASSSDASASVTEYRNVDQSTPFSATTSAKNNNNSPSITIASATNEIVLSSISTIQENPDPISEITVISETSSNNSYNNLSKKAGAASVTMSYTFASGNSDNWVIVAGSMKAATSSLPVELSAFSAKQNTEENVELTWTTASELNNDYFEIEKSTDGKNFSSIARINGNGTSNNYNNYNLEDKQVLEGSCYYRLIQVDFDGTKTIHQTIALDLISSNKEKMIVNTMNNSLIFSQLEENKQYKIMVFNANGVLSADMNLNGNSNINLGELTTGMYIISLVKNSNEIVLSQNTIIR